MPLPIPRVEYKTLYSDTVYPLDSGGRYIARLNKEWVEEELLALYGCDSIANKYCVPVGDLLITNHDGKYFLTEFKNE